MVYDRYVSIKIHTFKLSIFSDKCVSEKLKILTICKCYIGLYDIESNMASPLTREFTKNRLAGRIAPPVDTESRRRAQVVANQPDDVVAPHSDEVVAEQPCIEKTPVHPIDEAPTKP